MIAFLDKQCTRLLMYPHQMCVHTFFIFRQIDLALESRFKDFVREDAVIIASQFYLVCLSLCVIIYESRPHL